jgi:hypothetical protein
MSSGAECGFTEAENGTWTYRLQEWPYGDNDDFTTYGPFRSFAVAYKDLHDNHQNPGGHSIDTQPEGKHRHEWAKGWTQVPVGVEVQIGVDSLGPNATKQQVIRYIQALPVDHPAFRTWTRYGQVEAVRCESCHAVQE